MPNYDYFCQNCHKDVRLFFSYIEYDKAEPICPHCESNQLKRQISRVAIGHSKASKMDSLMDDPTLANLDGDDPKALGSFMRKMSGELGEDMGDEFNEIVNRLEKGETPEKIEEAMPELKDEK